MRVDVAEWLGRHFGDKKEKLHSQNDCWAKIKVIKTRWDKQNIFIFEYIKLWERSG